MPATEQFAATIPEGVDFAVAPDGTIVPRQEVAHRDRPRQMAGEAKTVAGDGWTMTEGTASADDRMSPQPVDSNPAAGSQ